MRKSIWHFPADNMYIVNKREKDQKRFFKCPCCGKEFDFENSDDYIEAVKQHEADGGECYACANGFCHCKKQSAERGRNE